MNTETQSEQDINIELTERIMNGDEQAFADYIAHNKRRLYSVVYNIVKNHDDTEDLVQETIIKAYKNLSSFKGKSQLHTWLHTIAVNTAINFIKRRNKRMNYSIDDANENIMNSREFLESTTVPDATDEIMAAELREEVHMAIDKLKDNHKQIINWIHIDGLNHKEIAVKLGIPLGTVRSRLHYAHRALKKLIS